MLTGSCRQQVGHLGPRYGWARARLSAAERQPAPARRSGLAGAATRQREAGRADECREAAALRVQPEGETGARARTTQVEVTALGKRG